MHVRRIVYAHIGIFNGKVLQQTTGIKPVMSLEFLSTNFMLNISPSCLAG